tara:strand:+ start:69 stop:731 length:663 start_codon:yes stop_codon:yes gene_type:complete
MSQQMKDLGYATTFGYLTESGLSDIMNRFAELESTTPEEFTHKKCLHDLGSGHGHVLFYAAKNYPNLRSIKGVEMDTDKYNIFQNLLAHGNEVVNTSAIDCSRIENSVGDMFADSTDISKSNIIYISNLCFGDEMNKKLVKKLSDCMSPKRPTYVFCSRELNLNTTPNIQCKYMHKVPCKQSWMNGSNMNLYKLVKLAKPQKSKTLKKSKKNKVKKGTKL